MGKRNEICNLAPESSEEGGENYVTKILITCTLQLT